jgi:hypothetical protein
VDIERFVMFPAGLRWRSITAKIGSASMPCEGVISFEGVLGAKTLIVLALRLIPSAALPAMAPRIDLLECLADVFVGGVLCTPVALAI